MCHSDRHQCDVKAEKYKTYGIELDERNVGVFFNTMCYSHEGDFNEVGNKIAMEEVITTSNIDRTFVFSGMYGLTLIRGFEDGKIHFNG